MVSVGLAKTAKQAVKLGACSQALFCIYIAVHKGFVKACIGLGFVKACIGLGLGICRSLYRVRDFVKACIGLGILLKPV